MRPTLRGLLVLAALGTTAVPLSLASAAPAPTGSDWASYGRNPTHTSASFGDTAITTANAGHLRRAWQLSTTAGFDASPTVVAGTVYIGSRSGLFYALDAATGATRWTRQLDKGSSTSCPAKGIVGTAAVAADPVTGSQTVYAPGAHYLYALDPGTGAVRWKTSIGPATAYGEARFFNWSSPTVADGHIVMGLAANCAAQQIRGGVVSLDQHTGKVQHTWYDVPQGQVGGSVWSSQSVSGGSVWATTGNPNPNGHGLADTYSVVRLDENTLALQDHWTNPVGQAADLDFGSTPVLFGGTVNGQSVPLVSGCSKDGNLYVWRQGGLAAGPLWKERVSVSASMPDQGFCITSTTWDYQRRVIYVASSTSTLGGSPTQGAVRELDPGTGAVLWQQPLPCGVAGTPTLNGTTHVLAVPMYGCPSQTTGSAVFLDATTGSQLGSLPATGSTFAQPVLAEGSVFVASEAGPLTAYRP